MKLKGFLILFMFLVVGISEVLASCPDHPRCDPVVDIKKEDPQPIIKLLGCVGSEKELLNDEFIESFTQKESSYIVKNLNGELFEIELCQ